MRQFSERMAAKHVLYAIDACYSGLGSMRGGSWGAGPPDLDCGCVNALAPIARGDNIGLSGAK